MKFKWIELHNYAGIYNGMGLNDIKLDFTKCKTNKIVIRGSNGSGKSTIMDAININPDPNDKFIPNAEARKNICITDNGVDYIIRYIHPITNSGRGTTKGYISKTINGQLVELNPNGNISSCKDVIYEEFELDANFMALSQLSSEDRGLVDRKPAERKKLLNNIINTLDTYNNIHKILNKKASIFKSTINSLTYKIDSIGDETTVKLNLTSVENRINDLECQKNTIIEAIAAIKVKISEYNNILQQNNYSDIVSELNVLIKENKSLENIIIRQLNDYGIDDPNKLSEFINTIDRNCVELELDIETNRKQIPTLLAQREVDASNLQEKQIKLDSLQSEYNYIDIKRCTEEAKRLVVEYDKVFNKMGLMNINIITKDEFNSAMDSLHYLKDITDEILKYDDISFIMYVLDHRTEFKNDMLKLPSLRKELDDKKALLSDLEKQLVVFESMRNIANDLNNRPENCKIDTCPYISSAIEANTKYPLSEYMELSNKVEDAKYSVKEVEELIAMTERSSQIIIGFENIERELKSKMRFISKLPVRSDFESTFIQRVACGDLFDDINELYKYVDCGNMIEEYKVAKENLHNYEIESRLYESKNQVIESIIRDIEILTEKTNELANNIDIINNDIMEKEKSLHEYKTILSKLKSLLEKYNNVFKPNKDRENELSNIKESLDYNTLEISKLNDELNKFNNTLGSINSDIKNNTANRDELKHSVSLLAEYKDELSVYQTKYSKIDKLKYYSSPSTGIQTIFMQLYMNKIISIANNLLSYLFSGEFSLQPFIINESEFRIPCAGSGLLHDDISSMSTAQKCMISMILSFSLLYQSSTKYNVIKLDEIDGALDSYNRGYFITLLDQLMGLLKCEQCFIVSHNNELSGYNCDTILLKTDGLSDIQANNIIWQY